MSETVSLKTEIRGNAGSKRAAQLRRAGKVPAVIYGHGQPVVPIVLDAHDFVEHLHHGRRLFEAELPSGRQALLLKDLQYDHLGRTVIHADLLRVDLSQRVRVEVTLEFRGTCAGSHKGGILDVLLSQIEIECPVVDIPDKLTVSVKELDIGDSLRAGQVVLPSGCTLITNPAALLVMCHEVAAAKTADELTAETPIQPEVITERAGDEDEKKPEQGK